MDDFRALVSVNPSEAILSTLEDFSSVITLQTGAILYPSPWRITELPRNLHAAAVAAGRRLTSLDHVKKSYTEAMEVEGPPTAADAYNAAYRLARDHMRVTREGLVPNPLAPEDHFGQFAAAVALQRLESGFRAAHLLYRLGLNLEGDAVSRQILEQLAWAAAVRPLASLNDIDAIEPQSEMGKLKALLPEAGKLYGWLSDIAHAGLAEHRAHFQIEADGRGAVLLSWGRLSTSARLMLTLADAWVVVCEFTQADQVTDFRGLISREELRPDPARVFLAAAEEAVASIKLREAAAGDM